MKSVFSYKKSIFFIRLFFFIKKVFFYEMNELILADGFSKNPEFFAWLFFKFIFFIARCIHNVFLNLKLIWKFTWTKTTKVLNTLETWNCIAHANTCLSSKKRLVGAIYYNIFFFSFWCTFQWFFNIANGQFNNNGQFFNNRNWNLLPYLRKLLFQIAETTKYVAHLP